MYPVLYFHCRLNFRHQINNIKLHSKIEQNHQTKKKIKIKNKQKKLKINQQTGFVILVYVFIIR